MIAALFCVAALAQAQPDWHSTTGPRGEQVTVVEEPNGKRVILKRGDCPAYLRPKETAAEWRLVRETNGQASWRRWAAGLEDVFYPKSLAGHTFADLRSLDDYRKVRPDLKPPTVEQDYAFTMVSGIDEPKLIEDQSKQQPFASTVGLEPDEPPAAAAEVPPWAVAAGCFVAGAIVIAIGTIACLRSSKENQ